MSLKPGKDGKLVAGSKRSGMPKSTYINYNEVLGYEDAAKVATMVSLSIPDTAILAMLFAAEEGDNFKAYVDLKLGRAEKPVTPAAPAPMAEKPEPAVAASKK